MGPLGLRLVRLPASELSSIDELGRTLKQHPRVRFVVLCDPFTFSANSAAAVVSALSGQFYTHSSCHHRQRESHFLREYLLRIEGAAQGAEEGIQKEQCIYPRLLLLHRRTRYPI